MSKTPKFVVFFSVLWAGLLACGRSGVAAPADSPNPPAGEFTRTLTHGGLQRSYILYLPASMDRSKPVPLVFVFHGGTGNAESQSA